MARTTFNAWANLAILQTVRLLLSGLWTAAQLGAFAFSAVLCVFLALVMDFDNYFLDSNPSNMDKG